MTLLIPHWGKSPFLADMERSGNRKHHWHSTFASTFMQIFTYEYRMCSEYIEQDSDFNFALEIEFCNLT